MFRRTSTGAVCLALIATGSIGLSQASCSAIRSVVPSSSSSSSAAAAAAPQAQQGSTLSPAGQRGTRNIETALNNVREDPALFDGEKLAPGARLDVIDPYLARTRSNLNRAAQNLGRMSPQDRAAPEVQAQARRIEEMTAYLDGLEAARDAYTAEIAAADEACRAFEKTVAADQRDRQAMGIFVSGLSDPSRTLLASRRADASGAAEEARQAIALLERVGQTCSQPEFQGVGTKGCRWLKIGGRDRDPSAWCEAAARREELVRGGVIRYMGEVAAHEVARHPKIERLESGEGWIPTPTSGGPPSFHDLLGFDGARQERLVERFEVMFEATGLDPAHDPELAAAMSESLDEVRRHMDGLRAVVDRRAPTFSIGRGVGCNFACDLARRRIAEDYSEGLGVRPAVRHVMLDNREWQIVRNDLGLVVGRGGVRGHIVYQVPGEPWLRARQFSVGEDYAGGGRFQRATRAGIVGAVRFQQRP